MSSDTKLLEILIAEGVLQFGRFTLKSGRVSPYFFNMGKLNGGEAISMLGDAFARRIAEHGLAGDVVFGPAYKGIPLCVATVIALHRRGSSAEFAFNRKEAKTHGEGGSLIGASLEGRDVILVDDVLTAGTALREAIALVEAQGGRISGVVIGLDRQEKTDAGTTAVKALAAQTGVPVVSVLSLENVIQFLDSADLDHENQSLTGEILNYRNQYCEL